MSDTSFAKLFSSITKSTVWAEPHPTRIVWVTMLAECDRHGDVYASVPGLAHVARVTLAECETALATFLAPDPYSRTPDHDGRRIEVIPGGWRLLNYGLYREKRDPGARAEQNREAAQRYRDRQRTSSVVSNSADAADDQPESAHAEADTDSDKSNSKDRARPAPLVLPGWLSADAWADWHAYRNSRKGWTAKARQLALRTLTELWAQGHDPRAVIEQSIERGWTGLFPVHGDRNRGGVVMQDSKTLAGMKSIQGLKHGNGLVRERDHRRADEAPVLVAGSLPRLRLGADHGGDVD